MIEFNTRIESTDEVRDTQATGRDSGERSEHEHLASRRKSAEVVPRLARRRFSAAEKLRILVAADKCTKHGELGALMRREGIYSSHLATWRRQMAGSEGRGLAERKRGRKATNPLAAKLAEAERQNQKLAKKLAQAETIILFQKKFLEMFGEIPGPESAGAKS